MNKPVAVLISDVHYNIQTLLLADNAMRQAIAKANELEVPLIVAGDLHDTKANVRGECINAMRTTFKLAHQKPYVLVGNHDKINEKSEDDSLGFLEELAHLISAMPSSYWCAPAKCWLVPYHHDVETLKARLTEIKNLSNNNNYKTIVMHQGLQSALAGDYIQDKSAITHDDVKDFRVISGHYHTRQDIKTGRPQKGHVGMFSYIGNPYTLGFGEAEDPRKGFQILMSDGSLKFIPTNLRRHVIFNIDFIASGYQITGKVPREDLNPPDVIWVKVKGTYEQLANLNRAKVAHVMDLSSTWPFKLDLIVEDTKTVTNDTIKEQTGSELMDSLIEGVSNTSDEQKARLKELWRKASCG